MLAVAHPGGRQGVHESAKVHFRIWFPGSQYDNFYFPLSCCNTRGDLFASMTVFMGMVAKSLKAVNFPIILLGEPSD